MPKTKTTIKKRGLQPAHHPPAKAGPRPKKVNKVEEKVEIAQKLTKPELPKEREKYFETVGRRKTAVARVRFFTRPGRGYPEKLFLINAKPIEKYFPTFELQKIAKAALEKMKCLDKFRISAKTKGGGLFSQAEAIRHAISRALVLFNPDFRKRLKKAGFLKRDPRMKERKKFGLKRARKAPQWQKR